MKVQSIFSSSRLRGNKGLDAIGGGVFSLASGMAKRIRLLLDIKKLQESNTGGYTAIVRGRTIKRAMRAIGTRGEKLQNKLQELREDPKHFALTMEIFIHLIMLKHESMRKHVPVPPERVSRITDTVSREGIEKDAIIKLLMNFSLTEAEIIDTLEGKTAQAIKEVDFDLVNNFLISIRNRK